MEKDKSLSRKKFLSWGVGLTTLLAVPSALFGKSTPKKTEGKPVKLLTPDGKLVQVDEKILEAARTQKKVSNKEIYDWMNNPSKK
jgi:hypothetical protein